MSAQAEAPRRGRPSTGARERILAAATEVLKAEGYAGLTLAKVAAKAGESKALVGYHFGSKGGLVAAVGREIAELVTAAVLDAVEGADRVESVIRGLMVAVDGVLDEDARVGRLYFDLASVSVVDPEVRRTIAEVNEGWREVVTRLFVEAKDGPTPARARALAVMVTASVQGLALERIDRGPSTDLRRAQELFIRSAVAAY